MLKKLLFIFMIFLSFEGMAQQKSGVASFYHSKFEGRKTASGDIFSNKKLTAASNYYKLGELVKVTNIANGKTICVLINDRMAKNSGRLIDLTLYAAESLCFIEKGICKVMVEIATVLDPNNEKRQEALTDSNLIKH